MNAQEFATIASAVKAAYPNANIMPDKQSKNVWYTMLSDLDYNVCLTAIKEHMSINKFAPSISEIRQKCSEIVNGLPKDWGAAWAEVLDSIRYKGMYREEEALKEMEPLTRECVKRLRYQNICLTENLEMDRANFRMIYEQVSKQRMQDAQLPIGLQTKKQELRMLSSQVVAALEMGESE